MYSLPGGSAGVSRSSEVVPTLPPPPMAPATRKDAIETWRTTADIPSSMGMPGFVVDFLSTFVLPSVNVGEKERELATTGAQLRWR